MTIDEPAGTRRCTSRRDDGPLPAPRLVDADAGLWQTGYRDWDANGQEFPVDGETFDDAGAAWKQSQAMVAERKAERAKPRDRNADR